MESEKETYEQRELNDKPRSITASQKGYIESLLKKTGQQFNGDINALSKQAASEEIDKLQKTQEHREQSAQQKGPSTPPSMMQGKEGTVDVTNGILIGMAMKIVAYKLGVKEVLAKPGEFESDVEALHRILVKARQKCLASPFYIDIEQTCNESKLIGDTR